MDTPKGTLIAIGGGEDKERKMKILNCFLDEINRKEPNVVVITTATNLPEEVGQDYSDAFSALNVKNFSTLHIETREEANLEENLEKIRKADGVLFSGGNQLKLSSILGGTEFLNILKDRYINDEFVIAGTSAGAAAMSNTMMVKGSSKDALIKGELQLTGGLGLIENVVIDTHFTERGRFGRLIQTVATNPSYLGLGLGEDTAVIIIEGNYMEIVGSGLVIVVDGTEIKYTNLTEIGDGEPLTVDNIKLHVLSDSDKFIISERRFYKRKAAYA